MRAMPDAEPNSEITRPFDGRQVLLSWPCWKALSDDTGVLPIKTDAITVANIVVARMAQPFEGTCRAGTSAK
jgi:hypothetical protein